MARGRSRITVPIGSGLPSCLKKLWMRRKHRAVCFSSCLCIVLSVMLQPTSLGMCVYMKQKTMLPHFIQDSAMQTPLLVQHPPCFLYSSNCATRSSYGKHGLRRRAGAEAMLDIGTEDRCAWSERGVEVNGSIEVECGSMRPSEFSGPK